MSKNNGNGVADVVGSVDRDWLLQFLVSDINEAGGSMPITLWMASGTVSGRLIPAKDYYEKIIGQLNQGAPPEVAEQNARVLRDVGEVYYSETEPNANNTMFIHLEGAQLVSPSGAMPSEGGVLWRGRISQVTGFHLGRLTHLQ